MSTPTIRLPLTEARELAVARMREGKFEAAASLLDRIAAVSGADAQLSLLRAELATRRDRPDEAAALAQAMLRAHGAHPAPLGVLAEAALRRGDAAAALAAAEQAASLAPGDARTQARLALARYRSGDSAGAATAARAALARDPDEERAQAVLAAALLIEGDFAAGWAAYVTRTTGRYARTPLAFPEPWRGAALPPGRLLVLGDQGLGDVIQFLRYLPWVVARMGGGAALVLSMPQPLLRLLGGFAERVAPGAALLAMTEPTPRSLAWVATSQLPWLVGTRADSIPAPVPYLAADPALAAAWRARLDARLPAGRRRIGLVWAGSPTHADDAARSIPLAALAPLGDLSGVVFVALQKGAAAEAETAGWRGPAPLVALGPELADFADTAAVLAGLAALVTVDSAPAHLAGALGVPTLLLLPHVPDWRWQRDRADSPWYPTLRLFRQPAPRAWPQAVAAVAAALTRDPAADSIGGGCR